MFFIPIRIISENLKQFWRKRSEWRALGSELLRRVSYKTLSYSAGLSSCYVLHHKLLIFCIKNYKNVSLIVMHISWIVEFNSSKTFRVIYFWIEQPHSVHSLMSVPSGVARGALEAAGPGRHFAEQKLIFDRSLKVLPFLYYFKYIFKRSNAYQFCV